MSETTERHHGHRSVEAAVSTALVRLLREYTGRGPTKARTTYTDNLVVCVLADTLTTGERTLVRDGKHQLVLRTRAEFQDTMRDAMVGEIERLTERRVFAFMSTNHIDPDVAVEVGLLEPQDNGTPAYVSPPGD